MELPAQGAYTDEAPDQDPDPFPGAIRQDFLLDVPLEHVVPDLVRRQIRTREVTPRLPQVSYREVTDSDVTNLAGPLQGLQRLHRLSERDLAPRIGPVHLVKVDLAHAESLEAGSTRLPDVVRPQVPPAHLRRDEDIVAAHVLDRPAHDRLGVAFSIRFRRIDQVDAELDGTFHRLPTIRIPHVGPPGLAACLPHAESDRGDLRAATAQGDVVHRDPDRGTGPRPKNLSSREVEPLGRMVRQPEADEPLVVFVMIHVRFIDAPMVRRVEGAPVLLVDRPRNRTETFADEGRDVIPIFWPGYGRGLEDLLRLP